MVSKNFKISADHFLAFKDRKYKELDDIVKCQEAERSRRLEAGEDLPNDYELLWTSLQQNDIVEKVGRGHHSRLPHLGRKGNRDKSRDMHETAKKCRMEGKQYPSAKTGKIMPKKEVIFIVFKLFCTMHDYTLIIW